MENLVKRKRRIKKRPAWIVDVDGTLANVDSILKYIVNKDDNDNFKKDFDKFHRESIHVPFHEHVVDMVWTAITKDKDILVVTARREEWRSHTSYWLADVANIPHQALFMRGNKDYRPDYEVKKDILEHIRLFWDVEHADDDNPNVIRLWSEYGIPTTKIGDWDGT